MRSAEFTDIQEAAQYRRQNGGWLFVIGETNSEPEPLGNNSALLVGG